MYSHEIKELLKLKKNLITVQDYIKISESLQVNHIKFENEEFTCWTSDNYVFKFRLQSLEKIKKCDKMKENR